MTKAATVTVLPVASGVSEPLREELRSALAAEDGARRDVERAHVAIGRTRSALRAIEVKRKTAAEEIEKARVAHAEALAEAAADDDLPPPPSAVRRAKEAAADLAEEIDALREALSKLKAELPLWQGELRERTVAVESSISAILKPHAEALLSKVAELKGQSRRCGRR